ncbi:MAG: ABC transporter ATP-binding protein [Oscillospiraceae bacterium]|nr:ABC transporter ATP-binding protein [Oscillospiraceae bacterium]
MSIEVRDLRFGYGSGEVLRGVSFTAPTGRLTSVLGPNGVGKSTLFRCLLGLMKGYTGSITVDGEDTRRLSARALAKKVAYIPQSHYPSFNYSVFNMVLMGTTSQVSLMSSPGEKQRRAAEEALERVGVAHLRDKGYTNISGGERQLVLIARALVQDAKVLILDEPTANLDYGNQIRVMEQLRELNTQGYTVVQSTHNPEQAFLFSHNVVAMQEGRVLAAGAPSLVVTEELMEKLYGADIRVCSLYDDRVRVCVPRSVTE